MILRTFCPSLFPVFCGNSPPLRLFLKKSGKMYRFPLTGGNLKVTLGIAKDGWVDLIFENSNGTDDHRNPAPKIRAGANPPRGVLPLVPKKMVSPAVGPPQK